MPNGTVKFFNAGKGFQFITPDAGAKDVFVPAASITAAGVGNLKAGQRVSFEEVPDGKGPKAVNLKMLESPPAPVKEAPPRQSNDNSRSGPVTLYCDASSDLAEDIVAALQAAGHTPQVVDYIAAPPTRDKLKELSSLLRGTDQSLVRRYDHLFAELRLDDRFIGENEFWDAIVEHPSLINGPVVSFGGRAAICRSTEAVKAFLAPASDNANGAGAKRKELSPRLLKLMMGDLYVAPPEPANAVVEAPAAKTAKIEVAVKPPVKTPAKQETPVKAKTLAKPPVPAKAKKPAPAKAKPAPKAKAPAKKPAAKAKAAAKPVKKSRR